MNVLITGGAGFIGSELGKFLLEKGHSVRLLDNLEYGYSANFEDNVHLKGSFILRDVRQPWGAAMFKDVDVVFHLAGISSLPECEVNPGKAFDVNCTAVANLLSACRMSHVKRFILASTSAVYENTTADASLSESASVAPNLIYATTKYCAEQICKAYAQNYDMDVVICRFFNVFGPHQDYKRKQPPFTSYLVRQILTNEKVTIFNTEPMKRDYIYVEDLLVYLGLIMGASQQYRADIFNLSTGIGYSALEVANCVFEEFGRAPAYEIGDPNEFWGKYDTLFSGTFSLSRERIKKEVHKHCIGDNTKIIKEFGTLPKYDLRAGLRTVIDYQKHAQEAYEQQSQ